MKSEWKKCNLGSTMNFKNGKKRPSSTGRIPVYGGNGILDFTDQYNNEDCVVIGRVGAYCGSVFRESSKCWVSDNAICGTAREDNDIDYLYYLLKFLRLNERHIGTGQPLLTQEILNNIEILCPPLRQQKNIGKFLRTLDDKIALNNKINENLEQQAQALHQNYFDGIDRKGQLSDLCSFSKNKIAVSELDANNYFSTENMLSDKKGATKATNLPGIQQTTACHIGDVLVSNIRPYFKKILYCHNEGGCSTDVLCFVPKKPELSVYLYCTLYADEFFDFMVAGSKGTKMPRGDKQQIMTYSIYSPSDTELKEFNAQVLPVLKMIENNRNENEKLKLVRDLILPKLINGEIELN